MALTLPLTEHPDHPVLLMPQCSEHVLLPCARLACQHCTSLLQFIGEGWVILDKVLRWGRSTATQHRQTREGFALLCLLCSCQPFPSSVAVLMIFSLARCYCAMLLNRRTCCCRPVATCQHCSWQVLQGARGVKAGLPCVEHVPC
jgi:hypothetical protein